MKYCIKISVGGPLFALVFSTGLLCLQADALDKPGPDDAAGEAVNLTAKSPTKEKVPPSADSEKTLADPTRPTGRLGELMSPKIAPTTVVASVPTVVKLPSFVLRGFMKVENKPATAVLEVEGKNLFVVREGNQFNVTAGDGRNVTIKVMQVSGDGIELDVPSLKEHISLR